MPDHSPASSVARVGVGNRPASPVPLSRLGTSGRRDCMRNSDRLLAACDAPTHGRLEAQIVLRTELPPRESESSFLLEHNDKEDDYFGLLLFHPRVARSGKISVQSVATTL